jgi:Flp pilus assembly protein TadB
MVIALLLAGALAAGAPAWAVALVALAAVRPWWFLTGVAIWAGAHRLRRRRDLPGPDDEAALLRSAAAELAAGASLRSAVMAAAGAAERLDMRRVARLAAAGRPMHEVGSAVAESLQVNGRRAAAALELAGRTGAAPRRVLDALAAQATDLGRLAVERRALTAQARLSAAVVGGTPLLLLAVLGVAGRLGPLLADPAGRVVLSAGLGLLAAGIGTVALMVARAER